MPTADDAALALSSAAEPLPIHLNGAPRTLAAPTIHAALQALGLATEAGHIAVAVNDGVVPRAGWAGMVLQPHDRVEVITAVAGG